MDALERLQKIERTVEIDGWNVRVYFWSRDPRALFLVALLIVTIGAAVGWFLRGADAAASEFGGKDLQAELASAQPDPGKVIELLPAAPQHWLDGERVEERIAHSKLDADGKKVALAVWQSMESPLPEPGADLLFEANYFRPLRHANEAIGDIFAASAKTEKAQHYYEREIKFHDGETARAKLTALLLEQDKVDAARALADDPAFAKHFPVEKKLALAARLHRWGEVWRLVATVEKSLLQPVPLALALLAGLVWLAVAVQAVQPLRAPGFRFSVPLLAVFAGMLSTAPTLFVGLWQEEMMGLKSSANFVADLPFFIAGVGPREEVIKLLFFLPFVPALVIRKDRLETIVVAGCVGLGFAVAENLLYFAQAGVAVASGRFLTANFFHLAATGLIGLAFCEMLMDFKKKALPFLGILLAVTLAHGLYDALMPVQMRSLSPSMFVFMLLSLFFFRRLRSVRDGCTDQFSIAATLALGMSLLVAAILVAAARELGFAPAVACLIASAFALVMIFLMFYWQLGEGMSETEEAPPQYC